MQARTHACTQVKNCRHSGSWHSGVVDCSPSCWVALVAVGVGLNFHYALLGDSAIRGALGSAALVTGGNGVWRLLTVRKMRGEGLAVGGSRTVRIRAALDVDVYEPPAGAALRPAALYFHAGALSLIHI